MESEGKKIGSGVSGSVYAVDGFAIKKAVRGEVSHGWLREVSVLAVTDHANVIVTTSYDVRKVSSADPPADPSGRYVHSIKMELGVADLSTIEESGKLPFAVRKTLYGDVLRGLAYCHEVLGVLHRDLKPQNVIVFDRGSKLEAKIADFGLAAFLASPGGTVNNSQTVYTYPWRAPELWGPFFTPEYGIEVDTYAALVIGADLLFGVRPPGFRWQALTDQECINEMAIEGFPVDKIDLCVGISAPEKVPKELIRSRKATRGLPKGDVGTYLNRVADLRYLTDHLTDLPEARPSARQIAEALGLETDPLYEGQRRPRAKPGRSVRDAYEGCGYLEAAYATQRRREIARSHPRFARWRALTDVVGIVMDDDYTADDLNPRKVMAILDALGGDVAGLRVPSVESESTREVTLVE